MKKTGTARSAVPEKKTFKARSRRIRRGARFLLTLPCGGGIMLSP